ncbi:hypothetical protein E2C01_070702 [Portunus trituberculatus]|uniref:Uncharacterized protein n=1 Tax=Portunus trituberculatus TaxID=210409 RepID=A0A5B7I216_PORTR|nr:hypothetical protein [Portunus trituberculatus]
MTVGDTWEGRTVMELVCKYRLVSKKYDGDEKNKKKEKEDDCLWMSVLEISKRREEEDSEPG